MITCDYDRVGNGTYCPTLSTVVTQRVGGRYEGLKKHMGTNY